ncbi:hypothetical protein NC99_15970 [Sunxiuqinia dokdonensis]|uniref:Uncharacterized protein n=1 Tax=Sunxiuqinia dokdonensis TaxID=1409788 RepID=A0A0L8VBM6_9BACT|nr:hypothetical protein NC99_15970 [Sunxiuqinia dokdonensis]
MFSPKFLNEILKFVSWLVFMFVYCLLLLTNNLPKGCFDDVKKIKYFQFKQSKSTGTKSELK